MFKNKFLIVLVVLIIIFVVTVFFIFINYQKIVYSLPSEGVIITEVENIPISSGSNVIKNTPNTVRVGTNTVPNDSFFISTDNSIMIPLMDCYVIDNTGKIYYIPSNSELIISGETYVINYSETADTIIGNELLIYNPEETQFAYLSPKIIFGEIVYENGIFINKTEDGSFQVSTPNEKKQFIESDEEFISSYGTLNINTMEYTVNGKVITLTDNVSQTQLTNQDVDGTGDGTGNESSGDSSNEAGSSSDEFEGESSNSEFSGGNFGGIGGSDGNIYIGVWKFFEDWFNSISPDIPKINVIIEPLWDSVSIRLNLIDNHDVYESSILTITEIETEEVKTIETIEFYDKQDIIEINNLEAQTEYICSIELIYEFKEETYIIQSYSSTFSTNDYAVDLTLVEATTETIEVNIKVNEGIIYDNMNLKIEGNNIDDIIDINEDDLLTEEGATVYIDGLTPNEEYMIKILDAEANGESVRLNEKIEVITKKRIPTLINPNVYINNPKGEFILELEGLTDLDLLVKNITFIAYDENGNIVEEVTQKYKYENMKYSFRINESALNHGEIYQFQIKVSGSDNYSIIEIESLISPELQITGKKTPIVSLDVMGPGGGNITNTVEISAKLNDQGVAVVGLPSISIIETESGINVETVDLVSLGANIYELDHTYSSLDEYIKYDIILEATICLDITIPNANNCDPTNIEYYTDYMYLKKQIWGMPVVSFGWVTNLILSKI